MNFIFNVARGRMAHYASLPAANDSIVVVPLLASGIQADEAMRDHLNLSTLLAASTNESTQLGRKTLGAITQTIDHATNTLTLSAPAFSWVAPAAGGSIAALVFCYKPDTTSVDTAIVPLAKYDFVAAVDGTTIAVEMSTAGFYRSEG